MMKMMRKVLTALIAPVVFNSLIQRVSMVVSYQTAPSFAVVEKAG
jgi:hypothetical protein